MKLASLAGLRCLLRRSQSVSLQEEGGHCLFVSMETNLGRTVCLGKGCERHTVHQINYSLMQRRPGLAWAESLARSFMRGYVSQSVATANSRDSCTHNTSMSTERRGEKLAYGQSQRVTFGLEFTLGSDAHTNEFVRIVELRHRGRVLRFSSLEAAARKLYHMYTDIQQSNCMFLLTVTSRPALHIVFV